MKSIKLILVSFLLPIGLFAQFEAERTISRSLGYVRNLESFDMNGDGHKDVLASGSGGVVWYENNQSGGFVEEHLISFVGDYTPLVNVLDFDQDDDIDVLSFDYGKDVLELFKNNGGGDFIEKSAIYSFTETLSAMQSDDVDNDGDIDILVSIQGTNEIYVLNNDGNFQFTLSVLAIEEISWLRSFELNDVDMDGDLDVVGIANTDLFWLENDGDGHFNFELIYHSLSYSFVNLTIADLDFDGNKDIVGVTSSRLYVLSNDGDENFSVEILGEGFSGMNSVRSVSVEDLNQDGYLDLFYAATSSDNVGWIPSDGSGGFLTNIIIRSDLPDAYDVILDHFDGDDQIDIAFCFYKGLTVAKGNGSTLFSGFDEILIQEPKYTSQIATMDVDNDGDLDVVAGYRDSNTEMEKKLAWYENFDGEFRIQHLISDSPDGVDDMELADLDGDGYIDIVTSSWQEDGVDFYRNNGLSGFDAPIRITTNNYGPFALGDFNEDNSIDIVFISASGTTMFWMQNDGTGNFSGISSIKSTVLVTDINTADIDNDGHLDILYVDYTADRALWIPNDGTGDFGIAKYIVSNIDGGRYVEVGDLDGDMDLDVVVSISSEDELNWYENNGLGSFSLGQQISTRDFPIQSHVADLDDDGDLDIVGVFYSDFLTWFSNDGTGLFQEESTISQEDGKIETALVEDIDGNGSLDILAGFNFFENQKVVWYKTTFMDIHSITATASNVSCSNNNTPFDTSDDVIEFSLLVQQMGLGDSFELTSSTGTLVASTGEYDELAMFSFQSGSAGAGDVIVTITDQESPAFSTQVMIADPGFCSTVVSITATPSEVSCNNNNTIYDISDDVIEFSLFVQQTGLADEFAISSNVGTLSATSGVYGETMMLSLQPGSAGAGNIVLTITDEEIPSFSTQTVVIDPGFCSTVVSISGGVSDIECYDNDTPTDATDDVINFSLFVDEIDDITTYNIGAVTGSVTPEIGTYGQVTNFSFQTGSAGQGDVSLIVSMVENAAVFSNFTVIDPGVCSQITALQDIKEETVVVFPNPSNHYFKFETKNANHIFDLKVFNVHGQLMEQKSFSNGNCIFYANNLPKGIYFYTILNENHDVIQMGSLVFSGR